MVNLKNINLFTDEYGISAVEQSVVKRFVEKHNIPLQASLDSYFDSDIFIGKQILEVKDIIELAK